MPKGPHLNMGLQPGSFLLCLSCLFLAICVTWFDLEKMKLHELRSENTLIIKALMGYCQWGEDPFGAYQEPMSQPTWGHGFDVSGRLQFSASLQLVAFNQVFWRGFPFTLYKNQGSNLNPNHQSKPQIRSYLIFWGESPMQEKTKDPIGPDAWAK